MTNESVIYTKFTDSAEVVRDSFREYLPRSGHVITTMSAGWPLFFINLGANFCTVIDRNADQINYVLKKFAELPSFSEILESSCFILNEDFTQIAHNFWNGRVNGDEYIFLSNIWDHCVTEGRELEYVNQIKAIIDSSERLTRVTLLSSSFSQKELEKLEELLRNTLGRRYEIKSKQIKAEKLSKEPLKDFRILK